MFEVLLWAAAALSILGAVVALDGSRDVFHPLVFIGPMFAFLYAWMPFRLLAHDGLSRFFQPADLLFVQSLYVAGIVAFTAACLSAGLKVGRRRMPLNGLTPVQCFRLRTGGIIAGGIGLTCWLISIVNVGGFVNAFSKHTGGGWDDSGYIRDGSLLILVGVLLIVTATAYEGPRAVNLIAIAALGTPWISQAMLTGRRGPTFAFVVVVAMGWYLNRNRRPPIAAVAVGGVLLGWMVLLLVANRNQLYIGSDMSLKSDVSDVVETADTGNEYIYGSGSIVSADRRGHYFWMRRYLAQLLVRPIPSAIWPTKYEDFGVPELLTNAGTSEGFSEILGWRGAVGAAPGVVADLWIEVSWGAIIVLVLIGRAYGWVWRKAIHGGHAWRSQYAVMSALSIYLVMQTMEAVIFRFLLLSVPCWLVWRWTLGQTSAAPELVGPVPLHAALGAVRGPVSPRAVGMQNV